ncbi:hypothetical protein IAD21_04568 [Abditibacteriota bacterium]|nr:hypothetical protein IAD21_04568 [Abditibacteriota bacterium]
MTYTTHNKRKFGANILFTTSLFGAAMGVTGGVAHAQYNGAYGRDFSNPIAATLSIRMQHLANMGSIGGVLRRGGQQATARRYSKAISLSSIGPNIAARGQRIIAAGKATTTFKGTGYFVIRDYELQSQKYESSLNNHGLSAVDLADVVTFAIAKSLEFWGQEDSAQRVGTPQFKALKARVSDRLLKDARVQGLSEFEKNALAETLGYELSMIWNSYGAGHIMNDATTINESKARAAHLCEVWLGLRPERIILTATGVNFNGAAKPIALPARRPSATDGLNSPTSTVPSFESFGQTSPWSPDLDNLTDETESSNTPVTISFDEATRITNFKYTGAHILPSLLAQGDEVERTKTRAMLSQILTSVRTDLKNNHTSNLPLNNVARAQVYALSQLYPLLMTPEGERVSEDMPEFTQENMEAVRRQFALALGSDKTFRAMSDREKQEAYETYLLMPTLAGQLYDMAVQSGNEEGQKLARDMAKDTLQQMLSAEANQLHFSSIGVSIF